MAFRTLAAVATVFALAACGGGGSASNGGPNNPGAALDQIRALTNAASPAETVGDQDARAPGITSRADSLLVTTIHAETSAREIPTFTLRASCSGTACTFSEPRTGYSATIRLSDFEFVSATEHAVGTKHGVTLVRSSGRHDGTDFRGLGGWMNHSGFFVRDERSTVDGIRIDGRSGVVGGDLTGSRPLGSATWQGLMVGTPATGAGGGDRLQGDASLTYDMSSRTLDAAFTDIQNIDRLRAHSVSTVRFASVSVGADGKFRAGATGNHIQGGFYGSGHAEATGVFEQQNIVGAFGARQ